MCKLVCSVLAISAFENSWHFWQLQSWGFGQQGPPTSFFECCELPSTVWGCVQQPLVSAARLVLGMASHDTPVLLVFCEDAAKSVGRFCFQGGRRQSKGWEISNSPTEGAYKNHSMIRSMDDSRYMTLIRQAVRTKSAKRSRFSLPP